EGAIVIDDREGADLMPAHEADHLVERGGRGDRDYVAAHDILDQQAARARWRDRGDIRVGVALISVGGHRSGGIGAGGHRVPPRWEPTTSSSQRPPRPDRATQTEP